MEQFRNTARTFSASRGNLQCRRIPKMETLRRFNAKVRDLFDSMYRGYPVGYFLFWEYAHAQGTKSIGL